MDTLAQKAQAQADQLIQADLIPNSPRRRISEKTRALLEGDFCVDVHTHFFDKHCINSSYLILRKIKDFLGLRGGNNEHELEEIAYQTAHVYTKDYDEKLLQLVGEQEDKRDGRGSILSMVLRKYSMQQVYAYYIRESSLAEYFNLPPENVLTTVLMMDFKMGWNLDVGKSLTEQIYEQKALAKAKPVLPFLFCDPRRVSLTGEDNLYQAFNNAFASEVPFFGVKMYPCLGYDPFDYRLWPIYKICEEKGIPVLTHCGGDSISTPDREITVHRGTEPEVITGKNRKEVSYQLNDPGRWEQVLEKFPDLRLNIAHFGSSPTWSSTSPVDKEKDPQQRKETIMALMRKYDNVYSDFSYTISNEQASRNFIHTIKEDELVRSRSMFGSDFWVVYFKGGLKKNQEIFLDMVGDKDLQQLLCKTNPMNYLFGERKP